MAGVSPTAGLLEDLFQESLARILAKDIRALHELEWLNEGSLRGLLQSTAATASQDWLRKEFSEKRDRNKEEPLSGLDLVLPAAGNLSSTLEQKNFVGPAREVSGESYPG